MNIILARKIIQGRHPAHGTKRPSKQACIKGKQMKAIKRQI
jgi:hypothetical protein